MMVSLTQMVPACLAIGVAAGVVMHRSDYCLTATFRDVFLFRNWFMIRMLVLLMVASMGLFEVGRRLGWFAFYPFPLLGGGSLSGLVGGTVFGVGMVLAGGCVVGTLYKAGAGSLVSVLAFAGLIAGSAFYAEFHPSWKSFADATSFPKGNVTLPQLFGIDPAVMVAAIAIPSAVLLYRWGRDGKLVRSSQARGYVQPWKAALILALLGFFSCVAVGMPIGITTSYAKISGYVESTFFQDHFDSLAFFKGMPLDLDVPSSGLELHGGPAPVLDSIAAIQFPLVLGIVLGSAFSAISLREWRVHLKIPPVQLAMALAGGILMALGSRMSAGCNVWHLMGGLPIFALQSFMFLAGLIPGTWLGGRLLVKLLK
ncbi:MAG: YeeE/YedE family protein [Deltaproteobacteria bacterium]|nr:YeeE/YedE family protein [Deltaproteobacteria bacterium]